MNEDSQPAIGGSQDPIPTESTATIIVTPSITVTIGQPIEAVS